MLTRMGEFAESINLKDKAENGRPSAFYDAVRMANFRKIASAGSQAMSNSMMGAFNRGMQYSGAATIKQPADIQSQMVGQALEVENRIFEDNERYKLDMTQQYMNLLAHEDSMELQRRQLEAMDGDILDQIGQFASIVGIFA